MKRLLVLSAMGLVLALVMKGETIIKEPEPPTLSVRFDVGSDHPSRDQSGRLFLADQEWTPETQAGYISGYRVWCGKEHPVDGTPAEDEFLHTNQRHNWEEYRFSDIPNGDYLVTLSFSEIGIPAYTIFDVTIEGQIVLDDFRISDHVGGNYSLTRRFAVAVTDGELNVMSRPIVGEPRLAAIEVEARSPDKVAPATPADLVPISSYHAVMLNWADNSEDDLDGYHIYRAASPGGSYTRLTTEPAPISRYQDTGASPHVIYHYCVSAVDVYGNESGLTPCLTGVALDESDAALPLYELEIPPENLLYLYNHVFSDDEVNGALTYNGQTFPVAVRYRGGYGRFVHKKSWKIKFPNGSPFPGRDEINLRADYADQTLMHTKLTTDLFEAASIQVPEAEHVLLALNGEYLGVYTFNEQVDEGFLERTGHDPNTSIYKTVHTDTHDWSKSQPSEQAYHDAYDKKTNRDGDYSDIIAFIEMINHAPDETFADELGRVFDVATYLDYYAVTVLTSNGDYVHHNVYLLHDLNTDQWALIPYDFDVTFIQTDRSINEGTAASPIQPRNWASVLLTRVLDVPQFHAYYCHRLAEFMNTIFSDAAMYALIDETYAAIEQDGLRDWHKRHRENNDWFVAAPDELKTYVTERKNFLWGEVPVYCPADRPYPGTDLLPPVISRTTRTPLLPTVSEPAPVTATIVDDGTGDQAPPLFILFINEFMADNGTTLEDPDDPGEFPDWIEIYNPGPAPIDLGGKYLTDALTDPTRFRIPDGLTIPANGFVLFYADNDPEQGPFHTNFKLSNNGESIGLFDSDATGNQPIDTHTFGVQAVDVSERRYPNGGDTWVMSRIPTPGRAYTARHLPYLPTMLK